MLQLSEDTDALEISACDKKRLYGWTFNSQTSFEESFSVHETFDELVNDIVKKLTEKINLFE